MNVSVLFLFLFQYPSVTVLIGLKPFVGPKKNKLIQQPEVSNKDFSIAERNPILVLTRIVFVEN